MKLVVEVRDVAKAGALPPSKAHLVPNTSSADAERPRARGFSFQNFPPRA